MNTRLTIRRSVADGGLRCGSVLVVVVFVSASSLGGSTLTPSKAGQRATAEAPSQQQQEPLTTAAEGPAPATQEAGADGEDAGSQTDAQEPPREDEEEEGEAEESQAQDQVDRRKERARAASREQEALELVREIMERQRDYVSGDDFNYDRGGRRDPFRSLLQRFDRSIDAPQVRPPGTPGLLITDVDVVAVAEYQGRWYALLAGPDRRSHFAHVGDRLYDGHLVRIAASEVEFEQEVVDGLGARSTRRLVKRLAKGSEE